MAKRSMPPKQRAALHTALRGESSSAAIARMPPLRRGRRGADVGDGRRVDRIRRHRRRQHGIGGLRSGPRLVSMPWRTRPPRVFACISSPTSMAARRSALLAVWIRPQRRDRDFEDFRYAGNSAQRRQRTRLVERRQPCLRRQRPCRQRGEVRHRRVAHLPMWDWVRRTLSLWSCGRLADCVGNRQDGFERLLGGAAEIDAHALVSPLRENMVVWHALTAVWNRTASVPRPRRCCLTTIV